jgi:hypothetical protein
MVAAGLGCGVYCVRYSCGLGIRGTARTLGETVGRAGYPGFADKCAAAADYTAAKAAGKSIPPTSGSSGRQRRR